MDRRQTILIAIDESASSLRAVTYVGSLLGRCKDLSIRLLHVLAPMPPSLREFGGSEDPQEEARLSAQQRASQLKWTDDAQGSAKLVLDRAVSRLVDHGVAAHEIRADICPSLQDGEDIVQVILDSAKDWGCGTIVVGRRTLPWFRELFARHIAEELVKKAEDCAVWVVETRA
jgi:nucleotide-binding universal stress UspA family protein